MFLAGFMGTGKSSAGRVLAGMVGAEFVDLDKEIERREVMSITEIFERRGEEYFRDAEHEALRRVCRRQGQVVALGGGVVCFERNRELLEKSGSVVILDASPEEIARRVGKGSGRPLLDGPGGYGRMMSLLREREGDYGRYPLRVRTDGKTPRETAEEILGLLEGGKG